ncbi:hypothetical protein ACQP1W_44965 [Spirillospora sp. CA-255316]
MVAERHIGPAASALDPAEAFQTGPDIARHVPGAVGVPEQDGVTDRGARAGEAQSDPADVSACPYVECSVDAQVPGVQAEPGQGADPGVDEPDVLADLRDRHHAGEVDERGQESWLQAAGFVASAGEADDGLGDESTGEWSAVLEVGVEGLDGGDGQVGVAAPSDGEDPAAGDAALGEHFLDPGENLTVPQRAARVVAGRAARAK